MLIIDRHNMKSRTVSSLPPAPVTADLRGISLKLLATLSLFVIVAVFSTTASAELQVKEGQTATLKVKINPAPLGPNVDYSQYGTERIFYKYKTIDGAAKAGKDYIAVEGTLHYSVGEWQKEVKVKAKSDNVDQECKEDFYLRVYDKQHQELAYCASTNSACWVDISRTRPPDELPKIKVIIRDQTQSYHNQKYGSCGSSSNTYGE